MNTLLLGAAPLSLDDVWSVAIDHRPVALDPAHRDTLTDVRARVETLLGKGAPNTYGVNTGFGALAEVRIDAGDLARLQLNLIRSHAAGVGPDYPESVVRAMLLLRAMTLCLGTSGVRPEVPELLLAMLNAGVHPCVPEQGSLGASGDLAPLAHLALVLIGEGEARVDGQRMSGAEALSRAGLQPVVLAAKEGLALINGTQAMTADLALTVQRATRLAAAADIIGALSLEVLLGSPRPFDARVHAARPHVGQGIVAANLRHLTAHSPLVDSHRDCGKVQDPYCLRCMPQVHGASRDTLRHVAQVVEVEVNSATDNPLVFVDEAGNLDIISGGNFHGQPVALVADFLGIAMAELGSISERRVEQLVNPSLSSGLPPFLAGHSGLESGFMIAQVTAAALVSENKSLAHPASVDSIPSSANREDHVSMGTIAARQARAIVANAERVLGIEFMCAAQGLDLRRPLHAAPPAEAAHAALRAVVPVLDGDRVLSGDIEAAARLIRSGGLQAAVEAVAGTLP